MTLLLWIGLGVFFSEKVNDLGIPLAEAGWEYSETARPKKRRGDYPKPSRGSEGGEDVPVEPSGRVQVFGKPATEMSPDEYAEMVREDQAAPVAAEPDESNTDFEALRSRMRNRRVAETEGETESDYEAAPEPAKKAKPPRAEPAYIPPPPMETEVITPQKPTGKKVKSAAKVESASESEATRGGEVNAAFPYTHLLPSPFNLSRGTAVFGTTVAYGLLDFLQVSTNLARTIQQQWNFQAKVPLVEYPTFVASAFVDYQTFNTNTYDDTNPDTSIKRWQPGLVTGYEITPDIAFFLGGNFSFGKAAPEVVTTSGYLRGAQVNMEWSWLYNPSSSRLGNNAIALGMKYDFTYALFGFGFTHHWRNFEAGLHYTFADRSRFLPIVGFTVSSRF